MMTVLNPNINFPENRKIHYKQRRAGTISRTNVKWCYDFRPIINFIVALITIASLVGGYFFLQKNTIVERLSWDMILSELEQRGFGRPSTYAETLENFIKWACLKIENLNEDIEEKPIEIIKIYPGKNIKKSKHKIKTTEKLKKDQE